METWELIAREAIRETLARYAHCADSGRFGDLANLFAEDGVLEIDGREPLVGRVVIVKFLGNTKASLGSTLERPYIRHHTSSVSIELHDERTASSRSYFLAITECGPDHWGRYRDDLALVDGRWLFGKRRVKVDGHSPTSWRATRDR